MQDDKTESHSINWVSSVMIHSEDEYIPHFYFSHGVATQPEKNS